SRSAPGARGRGARGGGGGGRGGGGGGPQEGGPAGGHRGAGGGGGEGVGGGGGPPLGRRGRWLDRLPLPPRPGRRGEGPELGPRLLAGAARAAGGAALPEEVCGLPVQRGRAVRARPGAGRLPLRGAARPGRHGHRLPALRRTRFALPNGEIPFPRPNRWDPLGDRPGSCAGRAVWTARTPNPLGTVARRD